MNLIELFIHGLFMGAGFWLAAVILIIVLGWFS